MRSLIFLAFLPGLTFAQEVALEDSVPLLLRHISPEDAKDDLNSLLNWVFATHPAARMDDSLNLKGAVNRAASQFRYGGSNWMFARLVAEVLATLGDSHTGLHWHTLTGDMEDIWGKFPGSIELDGGQIRVVESDQIPASTVVDSVGNWKARAVLENARNMTSSESFAHQSHYRRAERLWPWFAAVPSPGATDPTSLRVQNKDTAFWVSTNRHPEIDHRVKRETGLVYTFENGIATLKISSFAIGHEGPYHRKLKRIFRKIKRMKTIGLVVDLRGNSGGLASRMEKVASHLIEQPDPLIGAVEFQVSSSAREAFPPDFDLAPMKRRERWARTDRWAAWRLMVDALPEGTWWKGPLDPLQPHRRPYQGPVAVLVDGGTASTAVHFASWAASKDRMATIGEPALSGISGTGAHAATWTLPISGLPVSCSTMRIWMNATPNWEVGQWMPEIIAPRNKAADEAAQWLHAQ